jgi:hypothetical protein
VLRRPGHGRIDRQRRQEALDLTLDQVTRVPQLMESHESVMSPVQARQALVGQPQGPPIPA